MSYHTQRIMLIAEAIGYQIKSLFLGMGHLPGSCLSDVSQRQKARLLIWISISVSLSSSTSSWNNQQNGIKNTYSVFKNIGTNCRATPQCERKGMSDEENYRGAQGKMKSGPIWNCWACRTPVLQKVGEPNQRNS